MPENNYSRIVDDPLNMDWQYYWEKELNEFSVHNQKDWDIISKKFRKWMKKDDYPEKLLERIQTEPQYSILDLGCGEGVVTIPLAKEVLEVTCVDSSAKMLEFLRENAEKEGLDNLKYVHGDLMDINLETVGKHDIVVASRSLNGIYKIEDLLKKINEIGRYVYITLWGPENRKYKQMVRNLLDKDGFEYPSYIYVYNLLYQMGIIANVERLKGDTVNIYETVEEAVDKYRRKMGGLSSDEEEILKNHLKETLITEENGTLKNPYEKADWILIWWKNE